MTKETNEIPVRLAFRGEGPFYNAYFARQGTMEDADLLGSIRFKFIERKDRRDQFIELMKDVFADMIEDLFGYRPEFPDEPEDAPEHERAGNA